MGNYKFRLADMMPNAWFYKLRDMSKKPRNQISSSQTLNQKIAKKKKKSTTFHNSSSSYSSSSPTTTTTTTVSFKPHQPYQHSPRKSYYFTRDLNVNSPTNPQKPRRENQSLSDDPPRKSSSKQRSRRRKSGAKPSQKQPPKKPDSSPEFTPESSPEKEFPSGKREFRCDAILGTKGTPVTLNGGEVCTCKNDNDIVIDVDKASLNQKPDSPAGRFESFAKLELPPIITRPSSKSKKEKNSHNISSPGIRLRVNHSPRIIHRRVSGLKKTATPAAAADNSRRSRSLSDSFAVVKSSSDPQKDFRDSMLEMIVENNIRDSKDLEDLLACYLSLNADEYHGMIIKVFKQIWFDLTDIS